MQLQALRNRHVLMADVVCFTLTPLAALALRLDFFALGERHYTLGVALYTLISVALKVLILHRFGLYQRYWRYASTGDARSIAYAVAISTAILTFLAVFVQPLMGHPSYVVPRSLPVIDGILSLLAAGLVRFSVRDRFQRGVQAIQTQQQQASALIVGAGHGGFSLARELLHNPDSTLKPVGFVDDDPTKKGLSIMGLPVLGNRKALPKLIRKLDVTEVIIAMPTAPGKVIREVVGVCVDLSVQSRTLPSIHEIASGNIELTTLRPVNVEDLLRREPVNTDLAAVNDSVRGKKVLVSGGGGSIGRELCRQLLAFEPAELIVLGHGENSVFETVAELQGRLRATTPIDDSTDASPRITPLIADIRSRRRIGHVVDDIRPEVVFHAAAHKHVPLMEMYPCEAVTTNIQGTQNLLEASASAGVSHFVFISSDKAVRPSSVMGATKRVAELLVQAAAQRTGKNYQTVRFGNVLGSRGSVILTFQDQIAAGGPITVTHPEVTRYFMTIPEAVQLVLQASVLGNGGEVFVLDMGEPIRILDLAKDMIRLSGLQEGHDIGIDITGLQGGEKLFEDLFQDGETYERSEHEKIFSIENASGLVPLDLNEQIDSLHEAVVCSDSALIIQRLTELLPDFKPSTNGSGRADEACQDARAHPGVAE